MANPKAQNQIEVTSGPKKWRTRRWIFLLATILLGGSTLSFWSSDIALFFRTDRSTSTVLVLDNCDDDFRTPPFEDAVMSLGPAEKSLRLVTNLNVCQTVGGGRSLSVSHDGRFFVVCENVGKHLTAYDTQTKSQLWSVDGEFTSATVAPNGTVYAIISSGTIYGARTVVIEAGNITKQSTNAGFDMVLDSARHVVWLVGASIKKCDLELKSIVEIDPVRWCAVSVDVNADGSIWVAEREHPNVGQSTNRILKISPSGQILKTVDLAWSPLCLRVDRSDGSVWVTGKGISKPRTERWLESIERKTGAWPISKKVRSFLTRARLWPNTHKYDQNGKLIHKIEQGGHTIDIDSSDSSVWLAGMDKIHHYSREGIELSRLRGVSADQKYVVIVPTKIHATIPTSPP